ncbi:unnamed protein product, partial [Ectocarpus fasciculatus]
MELTGFCRGPFRYFLRLCVARALGLIWLTFARKAVVTPLLLLLLLLLVLQLHLPYEKCVFFFFSACCRCDGASIFLVLDGVCEVSSVGVRLLFVGRLVRTHVRTHARTPPAALTPPHLLAQPTFPFPLRVAWLHQGLGPDSSLCFGLLGLLVLGAKAGRPACLFSEKFCAGFGWWWGGGSGASFPQRCWILYVRFFFFVSVCAFFVGLQLQFGFVCFGCLGMERRMEVKTVGRHNKGVVSARGRERGEDEGCHVLGSFSVGNVWLKTMPSKMDRGVFVSPTRSKERTAEAPGC